MYKWNWNFEFKGIKKIADLLRKLNEKNGKYIDDWKEFFTRNLILFFYINDFIESYGNRTKIEQYHFLLDMFNKKELSTQQKKAINGIIFFGIIPKLREKKYLLSKEDYDNYLKNKNL